MAHQASIVFHKAKAAKCLARCHDHGGNIKRSDSGIISAPGCWYLGRPENPPEHWAEYPPFGAHAHKAWSCDTSAGGAASRIYLCNQSEPGASPNPAAESWAFPPVIALRFFTEGVNENTGLKRQQKKKSKKSKQNTWKKTKQNTTTEYLSTSICIYLFRCRDWDRTQILGTPKHQNVVFHQKQWINEYQKQDKHRTRFSYPHPLTIPCIACDRGKHFCR